MFVKNEGLVKSDYCRQTTSTREPDQTNRGLMTEHVSGEQSLCTSYNCTAYDFAFWLQLTSRYAWVIYSIFTSHMLICSTNAYMWLREKSNLAHLWYNMFRRISVVMIRTWASLLIAESPVKRPTLASPNVSLRQKHNKAWLHYRSP